MPAALPAWPQVPACYGWLSLDRRGRWRLREEPVTHAGLADFLNRHYGCDAAGNWFVQNGPQQVFVRLEYTPLVLRLDPDGGLIAHTGTAAGSAAAVYLDDEGSILLQTAAGIGLLHDHDLPAFLDDCRLADGTPADEAAIAGVATGSSAVAWHGLPLRPIRRDAVAAQFGFRPDPVP